MQLGAGIGGSLVVSLPVCYGSLLGHFGRLLLMLGICLVFSNSITNRLLAWYTLVGKRKRRKGLAFPRVFLEQL